MGEGGSGHVSEYPTMTCGDRQHTLLDTSILGSSCFGVQTSEDHCSPLPSVRSTIESETQYFGEIMIMLAFKKYPCYLIGPLRKHTSLLKSKASACDGRAVDIGGGAKLSFTATTAKTRWTILD